MVVLGGLDLAVTLETGFRIHDPEQREDSRYTVLYTPAFQLALLVPPSLFYVAWLAAIVLPQKGLLG